MKNQTTKKLFAFMLFLTGLFSAQYLSAQNCPANKVYVCCTDSCGIQECKCLNASQAQSWAATTPSCKPFRFHPNCCDGFRIGQHESTMGTQPSLQVYPIPVLNSSAISFSLEQSQHVSLTIFDMNGRLVASFADAFFEEGSYE